MMKNSLLLCTCNSQEHCIHISHDKEDNLLYLSIFLKEQPFFERLILGIQYIFGYKCKFGHFDEIILSSEHVPQLEELTNKLKK